MNNEVLNKLAKGLQSIRNYKGVPVCMIENKLLNTKENFPERLMRAITYILDSYYRIFHEYLISDVELKELVDLVTNEDKNVELIRDAITSLSHCQQ